MQSLDRPGLPLQFRHTRRRWFDNSLVDEAERLRLPEEIADPRSIDLLRHQVRPGWRQLELVRSSADVVHTRHVLMHLEDPERIVEAAMGSLRSGGVAVFEEADYDPLLGAATSPCSRESRPDPVGREVEVGPASAERCRRSPGRGIDVVVDAPMLRGGSAEAAFSTATFTSARPRSAVTPADYEEVIAMLADPAFWTPFAAVVCVRCRTR